MSLDQELTSLLRRMESRHFEHLALDGPEVAHAVCAFLNSEGGTVLVESGAHPVASLVKTIESELREKLHPPALWSVTPIERAGTGYCLVDVPAGRDRPYTVDGTIYIRKGAATVAASPDEIRQMVEGGFREIERWERRLIPGGNLDRLAEGVIHGVARRAHTNRNLSLGKDLKSILTALNLFRDGTITNAAEVLFGDNPTQQFPQARVRVTVYAMDKGGDFIDNRQFEGPALLMLDEVFAMLRKHLSVSATFKEGLQRIDRPVYPEAALREGLVNAFVHRDYSNFSGGLAVDVYPGRLVIWNSGSLPPGLKIGDLTREHPSMPRNPDIAQVFFLHGLMERIGRGTQKIISACAEAGLPTPQWKVDETGVTLTFFAKAKKADAAKLNLREQKILGELKSGEAIRLPDYCERLTVSERQGRRDLGELVDGGWMEREGDGPSTIFRRTPKEWQPAKPGQTRPE
ncbi:MAG TPA: ATP-binding protein [Verrucomicrobiae bacterium]|nr:ATP-binding protein [Verrucomicrobiae bacterium]